MANVSCKRERVAIDGSRELEPSCIYACRKSSITSGSMVPSTNDIQW